MLWKIGLLVLGSASLVYYAALCIKLKKLNSTFSLFWFVLGCFCLGIRQVFLHNQDILHMQVWKLCYLIIIIFVWMECLIFWNMKEDHIDNLPFIIVLGAQVQGTRVTDSLARRLNRAHLYLVDNPATKVIVSGGQGTGEAVTEAKAMGDYLKAMGIDRSRILEEDKSKTTKENLIFSKKYIENFQIPIGIVSNNFHMYRAKRYAGKIGYTNINAIPCGCHPLLFPNYVVRESLAVVKFWIFF